MSTILTINPGSSSTKCGVVCDGKVVLDANVEHTREDFAGCATYLGYVPVREANILSALEGAGIALASLDAISCRGVGIQDCTGGTHLINEKAMADASDDVAVNHPALVGICARGSASNGNHPSHHSCYNLLNEIMTIFTMSRNEHG